MLHWDKIEQALMEGKAIFAQVKLAPVGDHTFTIVAEDGRVYVLHAWQGEHGLRAEKSMPIPEMMAELKKLTTNKYNGWFRGTAKIREARARLWGQDHMGPTDMGTRISFSSIASGEPKKPLIENGAVLERLSNEYSAWKTASSEQAAAAAEAEETPSTGDGFLRSPEFAVGFAAALGFVLGAGIALHNKADWEEALEDGVKSGLAAGIGEGVGIAVGGSVIRSGAAAGAVMFGIMAIWDVAEWANNDITGVQLCQKLAQGAVGGVAGGIAAGAAGGALLGPVCALFGGLFGGIAGGFGGAAVGKAIDEAIWDEGEDSVMNTYKFFGWHSVHRGTRPTRKASEIRHAYLHKVWNKPSQKFTDHEWSTVCNAHLMVLL